MTAPSDTPMRRMTRVALGATAGLVVGTAVQVGTGWPPAAAAGAAAGAVAAVVLNRVPRRGA